MIQISSDFECGNAKNVQQLGDGHFRLEPDADKQGGYCVYYCFEVRNDGPATEVTVEFWEDSQFGGPTGFPVFWPATVWVATDGLKRYRPLHETTPELRGNHIIMRLPVGAEGSIRAALTFVAPYSEVYAELRRFAEQRPGRGEVMSLGQSVEGRELLGLRVGTPGKPKVLCVAGQHPHEHSGVWAVLGMADYLSSLVPEAAALREEFEFEIVPIVNPDGNVAGRNAFNAEKLDMYSAFGETPDADQPEAHENRLLWDWAVRERPALWVNFHAYTGWKSNSEYPYEGWYEVADRGIFAEERQRRLYEALCDTLRLTTEAPSTHLEPGIHSPTTLCYQLAARYGIPHAFYECNNSTSGRHTATRRGVQVLERVMGAVRAHMP